MFDVVGVDNIHIGVTPELQEKLDLVDCVALSYDDVAEAATEAGREDVIEQLENHKERLSRTKKRHNPTAWDVMKPGFWNSGSARRAEVPSRGGLASARALATIAHHLATGNRIISEETRQEMHGQPTEGSMLGGLKTFFTQGGVNCFLDGWEVKQGDHESQMWAQNVPRGMFGWNGYGGSVHVWDVERGIGFAYVPTYLAWYGQRERAIRCLKALYHSLENLERKV